MIYFICALHFDKSMLNECETNNSYNSNSSHCHSSGRGIRLPPCGRGLCRFTGNTRNQEVESFSSRHKTKNKKRAQAAVITS